MDGVSIHRELTVLNRNLSKFSETIHKWPAPPGVMSAAARLRRLDAATEIDLGRGIAAGTGGMSPGASYIS
jgi:hypothetical protein